MTNIDNLRGAVFDKPKPILQSALDNSRGAPSSRVKFSPYASFGKRLFDLLAVVLALPVILPLILVFGLLVWLDGGSPLYSQLRVGRGGRSFRMWKLRSMRVDADEVLAKVLAEDPCLHAEWQIHQKLKSDPRSTRVGRLIRKTSMDELPQLWNVVLGEMSLVGPRPIMLSQKGLYPGKSYYALRPGITGHWQVSARNDSTFVERACFDQTYLEMLSLRTDFVILMKTVPAVVGGTGR